MSPAHPRVCGENSGTARGSSPGRGSSPRVRGKPERRPGGDGGGGLIPACAGKTSTSSRAPRRRSAHPRVCGENAVHSLIGPAHPGSSPRVRGKQHRGRPILTRRGLIPACAGKTVRVRHPHPSALGSSPRVRGKRVEEGAQCVVGGLIPACAGKTRQWWPGDCPPRAHPRVCGENQGSCGPSSPRAGSSPRVRGKQCSCDLYGRF